MDPLLDDDAPAVIDLVDSVPLVVVGAGLAALHVVARLPTALHEDVLVVDPSGAWLTGFTNRLAKHEVDVLRSTVTQVPFVNVLGLESYAKRTLRNKSDYVSSSAKFMPLPTTSLFLDYCAEEVPRVVGGIRVKADTVTALTPVSDDELDRLCCPSGMRVHFASGGSVVAHQVVYASSAAVPNVPAAVQPLLDAPPPGLAPDRLALATDVDLRHVRDLAGETVVVVGGGMTACTLACAALDHGAAKVLLVYRHSFKKREFEVDVGFLGNKGLYEFRKTEEPRVRLQMCLAARGQATINRHTWKRVQARFKTGALEILQDTEVAKLVWDGGQWQVSLRTKSGAKTEESAAAATATATAATAHAPPPADPAPPTSSSGGMDDIDDDDDNDGGNGGGGGGGGNGGGGAEAEGGGMDDIEDEDGDADTPGGGGGGGTAAAAPAAEAAEPVAVVADRVWVATGTRVDLKHDRVLAALMKTDPVRCIGGLPVLEEEGVRTPAGGGGETLRWPGLPLYLAGGYTALSIGPGARLLPGYRTAADKLTTALKKHAIAAISGESPYGTASGAIPIEAFDDDVPFDEVKEEYEQELVEKAREPPPSLKKAGMIDMDLIPAHLPRKIVEDYSWYQEDTSISAACNLHILIPLEEAVHRNNVQALFSKRSVELWITCEENAYHFYIQNLYKDIIPDQCYFKVKQSSQRVTVILKKYDTNPWRFLRS